MITRQKMSRPSHWPKVGYTKCHRACDGRTNCLSLTSDHHSRARDADVIFFQPEFVMTLSVTFCRTDDSKKKVMTKWLIKRWLLKWHEACIGPHQSFEHLLWLSQLSTWRWYGFYFSKIFVWHWQWHFAALHKVTDWNVKINRCFYVKKN